MLFPVIGSVLFFEEIFHDLLLFLIIPSSSLAVLIGCRRHKDVAVFLLVALGLSLLIIGIFVAGESRETILALIGSLMMAVGHIRNFRLCNKADCCHQRMTFPVPREKF